MNRRIWSKQEKTVIVLEMIKGGESMAAICTRHGVSVSQAYRWQEQFLAGGRAALVDRRGSKGRDPVEDENRRLKELVGQQALVIEAQKKAGGGLATAMKRKLVDTMTTKGTPRTAAMKAVGLVSSSYYYRPVSKRKPRALAG